MSNIQALLKEYNNLFMQIFTEMKWIQEEFGDMRIELWLDVDHVNHQPYHLNSMVKEKVEK